MNSISTTNNIGQSLSPIDQMLTLQNEGEESEEDSKITHLEGKDGEEEDGGLK